MKHYLGFAVRIEEKAVGIFKRKKQEEIFCRIRVGADDFADAQQTLCDKMAEHNIMVAIITPYLEEEA